MSGICSHVTIRGASYTSYTYTKSASTQAIATDRFGNGHTEKLIGSANCS